MQRVLPIKNSFVTGEISPYLLGRTDLIKYPHACEELSNFIVRIQGGISRRPGLRYISQSPGPGRLIPFIFNSQNSYVLLFLGDAIEFFTNDGQIMDPINPLIPYGISSPYGFTNNLEDIKYVQIGDTMYLTHPKYPVQKLNRLADNNWVLTQPGFTTPPATQQDEDVSNGIIDIDSFTIVTGLTGNAVITSSDYIFRASPGSMIGLTIAAGTGIAVITGFQGNSKNIGDYFIPIIAYSQVTVNITTAFDTNRYTAWALNSIIQNSVINLSGNTGNIGDTLIAASAPVFLKGDIGKQIVAGTGIAIILDVTGPTSTFTWPDATTSTLYQTVITQIIDPFDLTSYTFGNWFLRNGPNAYFSPGSWDSGTSYWSGSTLFGVGSSVDVRTTTDHPTDSSFQESTGSSYVNVTYTGGFTQVFRPQDIGRFVVFSGGYGQIKVVTNATTAVMFIKAPPTVSETDAQGNLLIAPAPPGSWYLEDLAFTVPNGYPRACCFFQGRLWLSGTTNNPQSIWASGTDDFENFAKGNLDDSGIEVVVASGGFDSLLWMQPYQGNIVLGTFRGEYVLGAGGSQSALGQNVQAVTPNNISVTFQSAYGVTPIQPNIIQEVLFYIQRSQKNAYEMEFNIQNALYQSKDLNILNDIIVKTPFMEMTYQQNPFKIIWFITADENLLDGQMLGKYLIGLTYDKQQDIFAWHRHSSGISDKFVSITTIPNIVNNEIIDEVWVLMKRNAGYTVELMDYSLYTDFAVHTVFGSPVSSLSGLTYLLGESVMINADNAIFGPFTVVGDTYDFPTGFTAKDVQVGLNFLSQNITVRPEIGGGGGTSQGITKRWSTIWIRVYNSLGLVINGQFIPNRISLNPLNSGTPLFVGDERILNLGYDRDARVIIQQPSPLPADVLAMFGQLLIGEN